MPPPEVASVSQALDRKHGGPIAVHASFWIMAISKISRFPSETVGQLLASGCVFEIPLNQRSLAWDSAKMKSVWADLVEATNNEWEHFMGFMVFQKAGSRALPKFVVQDGQQRLMCLVSISGVLFRLLSEKDPKGSNAQKAALFNTFSIHGSPRLALDAHHEHLSVMLETGQPGRPPGEERQSAVKFTRAFKELESQIRNDLGSLSPSGLRSWVDKYLETLRRRVLFVAITVKSSALALKIFYRLNSGGVPLSQSDIAKNLAYLQAEREQIAEREVTSRWSTLVDLVPYSSLTTFLRYWAEMQDEEIIKEKDLHLHLAAHCAGGVIPFLDELLESAQSLHDWWAGNKTKNSRVSDALQLLGRPALAYPILWVGDGLVAAKAITADEADALASAMENYIFRELTVSKRKTNDIEQHLVACAKVLRTKGAVAAIRTLASKSADSAFEEKFRTWVTRSKAKQFYAVRAIERKLTEDKPTVAADFKWSGKATSRAWEIEHICPVAKKSSLSIEVNRIGNLVLLERALNRACRDKDFAEKRRIYKHGRKGPHPLDGSRVSSVVGGKYPKGVVYTALTEKTGTKVFGDKQIIDRQRELAALALVVWRVS
jgi:hypothetical protein